MNLNEKEHVFGSFEQYVTITIERTNRYQIFFGWCDLKEKSNKQKEETIYNITSRIDTILICALTSGAQSSKKITDIFRQLR